MNDLTQPFVLPQPEASWLRHRARQLRRSFLNYQRDRAAGLAARQFNTELNWREFWHGRSELISTPRIIQVGTNWTCNLKCSFCRLTMDWTQDHLKSLPPRQLQISEQVTQVVHELLPFAEMMVLTPLGEPLMWGGLDETLALHARLGSHNLALTTNGMLLNDKNCERIVRGQLNHLFVSIDSNDPEIYASMRVGGDLGQVEEGLRRLARWKDKLNSPYPKMTCNATFLTRNIPQLPSMVSWAEDLGFEELSVQLMEIENPELEDEFLGHDPELAYRYVTQALKEGAGRKIDVNPHLAIRNLVTAALAGRDVAHHEYKAASPRMPGERKKASRPAGNGTYGNLYAGESETGCATCAQPKVAAVAPAGNGEQFEILDMSRKTLVEKCHYPWYNLLIDTDGDARPCCWADVSFGNLNELDFESIWNGPKAVAMRKAFLANTVPKSCRNKHCRVDL